MSETSYRTYHSDVENMGLGLYGGASYDMGHRNRDGWAGPGSLGNQEARLYLQDSFAGMGLSVSVQGRYLNVVGELSGTTTPENIYIIGAHYDHISHDDLDDFPGGDDNASGTAGVLEAARILSQYEFESTIRFIGFNAEEDRGLGSEDYVNGHVIPGSENIVGMVNMDMILRPGWDGFEFEEFPEGLITESPTIIDADLVTDTQHVGSVTWARAYQQAADDYVPSLTVDATISDFLNSDHALFVEAGYPAFAVTENKPICPFFCFLPNEYYHTPEDASDRLANDPNSPSGVTYDFAFATDVSRAAVALLAQEAVLVNENIYDLDGDGETTVLDVDLLSAEVARTGPNNLDFDVTRDGLVDNQDVERLLRFANRLNGDANFDGTVQLADFLILSDNFGLSGKKWSEGDFDSNGLVQFPDFLILSSNFGQFVATAEAVPEPSGLLLATLGLSGLVVRRRRWPRLTPPK